MLQTRYLLRFDDVSPGMSWSKFMFAKRIIEGIGVKSILGVVPNCMDKNLNVEKSNDQFFDFVRKCMNYGDAIAQHGTYHTYTTTESGILGINRRSEFAGNDYTAQYELLGLGKKILEEQSVWQPYFMAPSHSFDDTTIDALKSLGFVAITDGYGFYPYVYRGLRFVPQLTSFPFNVGFGYCTICVHINKMMDRDIKKLLKFVSVNKEFFVDFKELVEWPVDNSLSAYVLRGMTEIAMKTYRSIRNS